MHIPRAMTGPRPGRNARILLTGRDSIDAEKRPISVVVNGHVVFRGRDRLPNGRWGTHRMSFPGRWLDRGLNTVRVTNLGRSTCTDCPRSVLVAALVIRYGVRG